MCRSLIDPTFRADMTLEFLSSGRNAFPGSIHCVPTSGTIAPFSWECRATVSSQGRLIVIAQGKIGRMIIDGGIPPVGPAASSFGVGEKAESRTVNGAYLLQFHDGRSDYGAINFSLAPTLR